MTTSEEVIAPDSLPVENSVPAETSQHDSNAAIEQILGAKDSILGQLRKSIVGQDEIIEQILISMLSGGHCLLTGAPGLAKTLLVRSLSQVFKLSFSRIQFTPDLMPADITGTEILQPDGQGGRELKFTPGPIFANVVLADEINRTPPKTQAALLEAMQEHQVTAGGQRHDIGEPFFVLATQNPIEMEGTYPLPEAQLDRFLFNVLVDYLPVEDELAVVMQTTAGVSEPIESLFSAEDVMRFQQVVRGVPIATDVARYAVRLAAATRPVPTNEDSFVSENVSWGAGTRAAQTLVATAKARAILHGRYHASFDDVRSLLAPTLRHRVLLNYRAQAKKITVEDVVDHLLRNVSTDG
ncbi:MAG: MoxR family ATPase [Planctomycetota bacterium]